MSIVRKPLEKPRRVLVPAPVRIAPLPNLPLFHKIGGRKVVVAGASPGAVWKAELLAAAGGAVLVLAGDELGAALFDDIAAQPTAGSVSVRATGWTCEDIVGSALAVGDFPDANEASRFVAAARSAGVSANVVDRPDLCDFQFGTIVNRSPIVLAISTDGGAPMLGQSIRARIESVLPLGLSHWAMAAREWRPVLKRRLASFDDRRGFWERFVDCVWANIDRPPTDADRDALIKGMIAEPRRGGVTIVGAGPGDPGLLTLNAVRALQSATVILYDDLVGPLVLDLARREARRVAVGKTGYGPSCIQQDINQRIVELAQAGETVVRLKGGDPLIFGRAAEEIDACRAAGIAVSIVPGISAAQGAAASLGVSLTERKSARRVQFVTGHGAEGRLPSDIDWRSIADPVATTVVYMPRATLCEFVARAVAEGLDPMTPAAAVASATLEGEAHTRGCVADIGGLTAGLPTGAPVTVIIGQVVRVRTLPSAVLPFQRKAALS